MELHKLVYDISNSKNIPLSENDVCSIIASCRLAGVSDYIVDSTKSSISNIVSAAIISHTNRAVAESNSEKNTIDSCPLCNKKYVDASLIQGRLVKYCPAHRVAMPRKK